MVRLLSYLLDLVVVLILGRALSRALGQLFGPAKPQRGSNSDNYGPGTYGPDGRPAGEPRVGKVPRGPESAVHGETARDPVCGMFVSTELSHRLRHNGQTLHFCSKECLETFQKQVVT